MSHVSIKCNTVLSHLWCSLQLVKWVMKLPFSTKDQLACCLKSGKNLRFSIRLGQVSAIFLFAMFSCQRSQVFTRHLHKVCSSWRLNFHCNCVLQYYLYFYMLVTRHALKNWLVIVEGVSSYR